MTCPRAGLIAAPMREAAAAWSPAGSMGAYRARPPYPLKLWFVNRLEA
jgi:hypothetical protein